MSVSGCHCSNCTRERHLFWRKARAFAFWATFSIVAVLFVATLLTACTVVPKPVAAQQASYGDDGKQDSGFKQFVEGGALIDHGARDRYNSLISLYGKEWLPPSKKDHGVTPSGALFFITNDGLQKFIVMSDWKKMGRAPKK